MNLLLVYFIFLIFIFVELIMKNVDCDTDLINRKSLTERSVCYDNYEIGCFSTDGILKHIHTLPQSPDYINTKFYLFTRNDNQTPIEIHYLKPETLQNVPKGISLAITIHGRNTDSSQFNSAKNLLLNKVPIVINVDWRKGAKSKIPFSPFDYFVNMANSELVGREIAVLVNKLISKRDINPKNVHIVSHSLGCQVAGFAGKWSTSNFTWKFGRITALDAGAPFFEGFPGTYLNYEDADFVDAIHTAAGFNILIGQLGFIIPFGHIDFYPNGGTKQPKCPQVRIDDGCNHFSSVEYFEASISAESDCTFNAFKCKSWADFTSHNCNKSDSVMGYQAINYSGRGTYYLKTTDKYPYCNISI